MGVSSPLHVAVGVVENSAGDILISFRDRSLHQGGLWEFPGGKVDPGESVQHALCREFQEELGITPTKYYPFKKILYEYADKTVLLDVWRITQFSGTPVGLEGQAMQWKPATALRYDDFPAANKDIVRLLKLPRQIPIMPQVDTLPNLLRALTDLIDQGFKLICYGHPQLQNSEFTQWYKAAFELCSNKGVGLLCGFGRDTNAPSGPLGGIHASANSLKELNARPCDRSQLFGISCHSQEDLEKALGLDADFAFLSPVNIEDCGGGLEPLGWAKFQQLACSVSIPIYALGGVQRSQSQQALDSGAFGVAGVYGFLEID